MELTLTKCSAAMVGIKTHGAHEKRYYFRKQKFLDLTASLESEVK